MAEDLELVSLFRGSIGKVLNFLLTCEEENSKSDIARGADVTFKTVSDIWPFLERHEIIVHTRTIGMAKMYSLNKDNRIVGQLRKIKHEINNHNHNNKGLGEIFSIYGFLLLLTLPLLGTVYFASNESTIDVSNGSLINITTIVSNETNTSNITEVLINGTIESITLPVEENASGPSSVVEINGSEALLNITAPESTNITEEPMPVIETMVEEIAYRHEPIVIDQRVQWYRQIKTHGGDNYSVGLNLPPDYHDLAMIDSLGNYTLENGTLILSGEHDIQMSFTTSPVTVSDEVLSSQPYEKKVTVSSDSSLHYRNVAVSASIPEQGSFRLIEVPDKEVTQNPAYGVTFLDNDGNRKADTLSWTVPELSTKEYLIQETKEPQKKPEEITFDRNLDCPRCGQHKAPPLADVNMTISAAFSGTLTDVFFSDYFPVEWSVTNPNGGTIESYNASHNKISWHYDSITESASQWYIVESPMLTTPPTNYDFLSEIGNVQSEPWTIIVSDTVTLTGVTISGVANTYRGDYDTVTCSVTETGTGANIVVYVSLQYNNGTTGGWVNVTTNNVFNVSQLDANPQSQTGKVSFDKTFTVLAMRTGSGNQFRCNASGDVTPHYFISSTSAMTIIAPSINISQSTDLSSPIALTSDQSDNFNLTCGASTGTGNISSLTMYAQWNSSSAPGTWNNFSTSAGNLRADQNTPVIYSDVTSTAQTTTFLITGWTSGGYSVRCYANSSNIDGLLTNSTSIVAVSVTAPVETNKPNIVNWAFNVSNMTNYSATQGYNFNATVTDDTGVSYVWLEQNFTGTLTNTTASSCGGNVYCYNVSRLAAGFYRIKWYANDSSSNHNLNNTDWIHYYQINKSIPVLSLTLNGTAGDRSYFNNTAVNLGNTTTPGYINSSLSFYYNTTASSVWNAIASPQTWNIISLPAGVYWVSMNFTGDQNYTNATSTRMLTLNDSRIIFDNLSSNVSSTVNYLSTQGYQFNATAFNSSQVSKVWLKANFSGSFANYTATSSGGNSWYYNNNSLAVGNYTYTWWANDTSLAFFNSSNQTLLINQLSIPLTLYINGTNGDNTLYNNSVANFTANFSSSYGFNITLYTNLTGTMTLWDGQNSPLMNYTILNPYIARTGYLILANFSNQNYSYTQANHSLTLISPPQSIIIDFNYPDDGITNTSARYTYFGFTPTFNTGTPQNCSLWTNASGTWEWSAGNVSAITNASVNVIPYYLPNGTFNWSISCWGNSFQNFTSSNRTLAIDYGRTGGFFSNYEVLQTAVDMGSTLLINAQNGSAHNNTGEIAALMAYLNISSATPTNVTMGLYDYNKEFILNQSVVRTLPANMPFTWIRFNISNGMAISANQTYFFGIWSNGTSGDIYTKADEWGGLTYYNQSITYSNILPNRPVVNQQYNFRYGMMAILSGGMNVRSLFAGQYWSGNFTNWVRYPQDYLLVNLTTFEYLDKCNVELNNGTALTNYSMTVLNSEFGNCYLNLTGLKNETTYAIKLYANTTDGIANVFNWTRRNTDNNTVIKTFMTNYSATSLNYSAYYLYNATYDVNVVGQNGGPVLDHEQSPDGSSTDTGYLLPNWTTVPQERHCGAFMIYYFNENKTINPSNISNVYWHFWYNHSGDYMSVQYGIGSYGNVTGDMNITLAEAKGAENVSDGSNNYLYHLDARLFNFTSPLSVTSDSIYTFFIEMWTPAKLPMVVNYPNASSFIILNVPDNATLAGLDSDNDGLPDITELYVKFTNPFNNDTDNDGIIDSIDVNPNDPTVGAPPLNTSITTVPAAPMTIYNNQSNNFNITCNVTALAGNASNVTLYVQWNSTAGAWNFMNNTDGPMRINETTPIVFSNVDNSSWAKNFRTFSVTGYTEGKYSVRCYANSSDRDGLNSNGSSIAAVNITGLPYGWLNVSYQSPASGNSQNVTQFNTFNVSMNVTCVGGASCGYVTGALRYNNSAGLNPDTNVSAISGDVPFYIDIYTRAVTETNISDLPTGVNSVAVGDANNDGKNETVIGTANITTGNTLNELRMYQNTSGKWVETNISDLPGAVLSVAIGDANNDGKNEIIIGGNFANETRMYQNISGGWAETNISDTGGASVYSVAIGDANNDGQNETVVGVYASSDGNNTRVYQNTSGTWVETNITSLGYIRSVAIGDADNDGKNEIAIGSYQAGNNNTRMYKNTSGTWVETNISSASAGVYSVAIGDADNDGKNETVIGIYASSDGNNTRVYQNTSGTWIETNISSVSYVSFVAIGDANNDGGKEVVVSRGFPTAGYKLRMYRKIGGVWAGVNITTITSVAINSIAIGDSDNTGKSDIVIGTSTTTNELRKYDIFLNPQPCGPLTQGQTCALNWTVNATGSSKYWLDVNFTSDNSNVPANDSGDFQINITEVTPPNIASFAFNVSNMTNYSSTQGYNFNATVIDTTGVSYVWLEQNFTGTLTNTTASSCGGNVYCYNVSSLAAGFYQIKWYANDTSANKNLNNTDWVHYYQVNKSYLPISLYINGTNGNKTLNNNSNANFTANFSASYSLPITLYTNLTGTMALWDTQNSPLMNYTILNPYQTGEYLIIANFSNSNYTYSQANHTLKLQIYISPWLNVSYQSPLNGSSQNVMQQSAFNVTMNVTCVGGDCGNVTGALRYNASAALNPDTNVSTIMGATPFYALTSILEANISDLQGADVYSVAVGDANNDGRNEIVVGAGNGAVNPVRMYNYSGGSWKETNISDLVGSVMSVAVGDANNDGRNEIVVGADSSVTNQVRMYNYSGGSWKETNISDPGPLYAMSVAVGDANNDGRNEIVVGMFFVTPNNNLRMYNYSGGSWVETNIINNPGNVYSVAVGDANNDGSKEIVVGTDAGTNQARMYNYSGGSWVETNISNPGQIDSVAVGDVDNDGQKEIVIGINSGSNTARTYNYTSGSWKETNISNPGVGVQSVAVGDANNDGRNEMVIGLVSGSNGTRMYENKTGKWVETNISNSPSIVYSIAVGDANNDMHNEIAIGMTSAANETRIYSITSNPSSCISMSIGQTCQLSWTINATGTTDTQYWLDANFTSDNSNVLANDSGDFQINITSLPDTTAPNIGNFKFNVSNMTNYSSTQGYQFNATVIDADTGISYVWIEQNFTGTLTNVTVTSCGTNVYCYNVTPLAANTVSYYMKWYANDSSTNHNLNNTDIVHYYQVNKSYLPISLYINGTNNDKTLNNNSVANFTASFSSAYSFNITLWTNLTGSMTLWDNHVSPLMNYTVLNPYIARTGYLIIANFSNQNYTYSQANHSLTLQIYVSPWLNVSYQSPLNGSSQNLVQYSTFNVSMNVTCVGDDCGNVTGVLRYNASAGLNPDTNVSSAVGDIPFYVDPGSNTNNYTNVSVANSVYVYGVAIGDVNNDGLNEIVHSGSPVTGGKGTFLGQLDRHDLESGVWYENQMAWDGGDVFAVAIGDANNDGRNDTVVGRDATTDEIAIFLNESGDYYEYKIFSQDSSHPGYAVAIGDADNDGKNEVAGGLGTSTYSARLYKNTSGTWVETNISNTGNETHAIAIGDVNNDGSNEIVVGTYIAPYNLRMYNKTGGAWTETNVSNISANINALAIGDADNDGKNEIVVGLSSATNQLRMYKNTTGTWVETNISNESTSVLALAIGDLNNNGKNEIAVGLTNTTYQLRTYENRSGAWTERNVTNALTSVYSVAIGKASNNKVNDLVAGFGLNQPSDSKIKIFTFYSNPAVCGPLSATQTCTFNWIVNATGAPAQYWLDANFTSGYSQVSANYSGNFQVNISPILALQSIVTNKPYYINGTDVSMKVMVNITNSTTELPTATITRPSGATVSIGTLVYNSTSGFYESNYTLSPALDNLPGDYGVNVDWNGAKWLNYTSFLYMPVQGKNNIGVITSRAQIWDAYRNEGWTEIGFAMHDMLKSAGFLNSYLLSPKLTEDIDLSNFSAIIVSYLPQPLWTTNLTTKLMNFSNHSGLLVVFGNITQTMQDYIGVKYNSTKPAETHFNLSRTGLANTSVLAAPWLDTDYLMPQTQGTAALSPVDGQGSGRFSFNMTATFCGFPTDTCTSWYAINKWNLSVYNTTGAPVFYNMTGPDGSYIGIGIIVNNSVIYSPLPLSDLFAESSSWQYDDSSLLYGPRNYYAPLFDAFVNLLEYKLLQNDTYVMSWRYPQEAYDLLQMRHDDNFGGSATESMNNSEQNHSIKSTWLGYNNESWSAAQELIWAGEGDEMGYHVLEGGDLSSIQTYLQGIETAFGLTVYAYGDHGDYNNERGIGMLLKKSAIQHANGQYGYLVDAAMSSRFGSYTHQAFVWWNNSNRDVTLYSPYGARLYMMPYRSSVGSLGSEWNSSRSSGVSPAVENGSLYFYRRDWPFVQLVHPQDVSNGSVYDQFIGFLTNYPGMNGNYTLKNEADWLNQRNNVSFYVNSSDSNSISYVTTSPALVENFTWIVPWKAAWNLTNINIAVNGADRTSASRVQNASLINASKNYLMFMTNVSAGQSTITVNKVTVGISVSPSSPANNTIVDRDAVNASVPDYLRLIVNTDSSSVVNITFKANLTNPITGQTNLTIGYNVTNSSGQAVFNWDPNASYYAGNYTWWAEANVSYTVNSTMTLLVYGGLNLSFQSPTNSPDSSYTLGQNVTINATLKSFGPESPLQLNTSYGTQVNSTLITADATTRPAYLNYSTTISGNWTGNYTLAADDPLSGNPYNVSLNATANYFFTNTTDFSRNFNVITNITVSITLYNAPINYSSANPGTTVNASTLFGFPMIVRVDNVTNVNVDVFVKSSNTTMAGPSTYYIGLGNSTFANNSAGTNNVTLSTGFQLLQNNIPVNLNGPGMNVSVYWWLTVPSYVGPGLYSNTIIVNANQS